MDEASIFLEALQKTTPAERAAYLDQACAGNEELRRNVEMLLKAQAKAGDFLNQPAVAAVATMDDPTTEHPGTVIGPYKLLQEIGEGGMGKVFMAEQTHPVRRKVALKVIKEGMDTRQVIARFEAERQALAMMDHVNIARVLDAGATASGLPYFVMELVHGVPITKYCDDNHLTPRERLELFVPVCQAIQHAHQKGIIHRDIKPSNVMITLYDGKPVPKVIDFGVAKATEQKLTERTLFTQYGTIVGTLEYMSPEQAEMSGLGVDTRGDIYSLGVLLYELLTGSTPLERPRLREAAYDEVLRLIREEEAPKPSARLSSSDTLPAIAAARKTEPAKLARLVRGELDWIVLKSLEKDRDRRYETASGFAADVQHYLHDEAVEACPPSVWYRFRKVARRNKGPVLAASLILLALIGGIIGTSWGLVRAEAARREAVKAQEAESERAEGERKAKQEAEAREAETKAVLDFVEKKIFAAARPKGEEGGLGYDVKLRNAIKAALPFVEKSFTGRPLIEARLRNTLGVSFWYMGDFKATIEQCQAALQLYTEHRGPDHPDTLWSMHWLAGGYAYSGRAQEAVKLLEETLPLWKAKLGPDHPDTLENMNDLAECYNLAGRAQEAVKLLEETLQLMRAKPGRDVIGHNDTLLSMMVLGYSYRGAGRTQEAVKLLEETLQRMKATDHPRTLACMRNLAICYVAANRTQEALELREETLQLYKAKHGPDYPGTLRCMNHLANSYAAAGRIQEALKLYEEALQRMQAQHCPDDLLTLECMGNLANSYIAVGRTQEARKLYEETLQVDPKNAVIRNSLAWLLATCADPKFRDAKRALELAKKSVELAPKEGNCRNTLGVASYRAGDWKAAVEALNQSDEMLKGAELSFNAFFLAMAHWQLGNKDEARKRYDQAVRWMEKNKPQDEELVRFRAEAEALLKIEKKPMPK
jgi:serine/threonine protein kinase/tetratricopeptide (TPR) repeat protein